MRPPIVLNAGGDICFFPTKEAAEINMEPIDVRNGYFTAYDSKGHCLTLDIIEKEVTIFFGLKKAMVEHVAIVAAEPEPTHAEELRQMIIEYFERIGADFLGISQDWLQQASLEELVQKGVQRLTRSAE